ncbi:hypothetical protein H1R20_g1387, partial [Candolleomyces eurysporus]
MNYEDDVQGAAVDDFDREYPDSDDGGEVREDQNRIITIRNRSYLVTVVANLESSGPCLFSAFDAIPPSNKMIQIAH